MGLSLVVGPLWGLQLILYLELEALLVQQLEAWGAQHLDLWGLQLSLHLELEALLAQLLEAWGAQLTLWLLQLGNCLLRL